MQIDLGEIRFFQDEPVPAGAELAGWAALVEGLRLAAPVRSPSCISEKHVGGSQKLEGSWRVFDKRYKTGSDVTDHLTFALRHENIDLLVLKRALAVIPVKELEAFIRQTPTGVLSRRIWFFYELLTGNRLELDDAPANIPAVGALDEDSYFTAPSRLSVRHRVRDNLLGGRDFCPVIRKSAKLEEYIALGLSQKAHDIVERAGAQSIARAASFMLLADSRASFEIEGERPPQNRLERWGRAVLEAGKRPLNQTEIYRLHRILIGDDRFTEIGYRSAGVFLGERDFDNNPVPEFIGARHADIPELMTGLNICNNRMRPTDLDAVLQAAVIAFGFVYIHPLADGNGRLHRCLIHHILAEREFTPQGMIFPVSSVMRDRIKEYRQTLQAHSGPLMPFIEWRISDDKNVGVTNDTADLYRYFDCTGEAEFLYSCVQHTVENDLPRQIDYLKRHDEAMRRIMNMVEMPDQLAQSLIMFIRQNGGVLGRRRRENEFAKLTDEEVSKLEAIIRDEFDEYDA